jgi:serine/threonine protein kinase
VLDIGEVGGRQYIALQFVQGKTVKDLIPAGGMADPVAVAHLARKLARTLHDIYTEWQILHRDVKPANMMVPDNQADGLYLMDFGLAVCDRADVHPHAGRDGARDAAYMAPEQARGLISGTDHRADCTAPRRCCTTCSPAARPFVGETIYALMIAIANDPPSRRRSTARGSTRSWTRSC